MSSVSFSIIEEGKRAVLTIEQKEIVLDMLVKSVSYGVIAEKFRIGKSTFAVPREKW